MAEQALQQPSLPAAPDTQLDSFTLFPKLPPEIRFMVWELLLPDRRIVEIDQNYLSIEDITRKLIKEDPPMLLGICKETRDLIHKKYQTVFQVPSPAKFVWEYAGSPRSADLRALLKKLHLPQKGTIKSMPPVITQYMNAHPNNIEEFKEFGVQKDASLITPQWYSPIDDVLLIKTPQRNWRYEQRLWSPWRLEASQVRHIAFDLDRLIRFHPSFGKKRAWSNRILRRPGSSAPDIRFERLRKGVLESITLLLLDDCEVIKIRFDETAVLKPTEWAFSLDTSSTDFKEQMGTSWTNVTWNVTLGKPNGVGLWDRAATWNVDNILWEHDKRELCRNKDEITLLWHLAERSRHSYMHPRRRARLVQGGDGMTYLGPVLPPPFLKW